MLNNCHILLWSKCFSIYLSLQNKYSNSLSSMKRQQYHSFQNTFKLQLVWTTNYGMGHRAVFIKDGTSNQPFDLHLTLHFSFVQQLDDESCSVLEIIKKHSIIPAAMCQRGMLSFEKLLDNNHRIWKEHVR